jgi:hypothetical protein
MWPPLLLTYDGEVKSECTGKGFEWQWVFMMKNIKIIGQSLIRSFTTAVEGQSGHSWVRPCMSMAALPITFDVWRWGQIWMCGGGIWMTVSFYDEKHKNNRSISYTKFWDCRWGSKWSPVSMTLKAPPSLLTYDGGVKSECTSKGYEWQWVFMMKNIKTIGQSLIRSFETAAEGQSSHSWVRPYYVHGGTTITFDIGRRRQICVYQWGIRMTMRFYDKKHKNKRSISYKKFPDCRSVSKWSSVSTAPITTMLIEGMTVRSNPSVRMRYLKDNVIFTLKTQK